MANMSHRRYESLSCWDGSPKRYAFTTQFLRSVILNDNTRLAHFGAESVTNWNCS